jgi:hypothetical protein
MKKSQEPYFEGTQPVYGKAARRLDRLIKNPPKATPEEMERMKNSCKILNGGKLLW